MMKIFLATGGVLLGQPGIFRRPLQLDDEIRISIDGAVKLLNTVA